MRVPAGTGREAGFPSSANPDGLGRVGPGDWSLFSEAVTDFSPRSLRADG